MKKLFAILLSATLFSTLSVAQNTEATFAKGDNVIGVGIGIGGVYGFSSPSAQSPVFGVQYDRAIIPLKFGAVIGVGGFLGYKTYSYKYYGYKDVWNIFIIGARGTFHYDLFNVENLDTYGGMMVAFHAVNSHDNIPDEYGYKRDYNSAAYASIYAGAKYYFTPAFGAFAEVGYGVSWLTVGAAFKF